MTPEYLDVAHDIGNRLADTAIWHEGRCNWMGLRPAGNGRVGIRETVAALGADLYGGTSGIALFLAELHAATGDEDVRRTAMGAIRHALARAGTAETIGSGLYEGRMGIAVAAARVGIVLRQDQLLERAAILAKRPPHNAADPGFDLISGRAGGIVSLLVLCRLLDDLSLLELAVRLADGLLATATRDGGCYTWSPRNDVSVRPLTGLAHGAAGIGYALLELFDKSGDVRYQRAAELAFAYEREHFNPEFQNWPDFRHEHSRRRRGVPPVFATQWCHGAPGVALSRLRAYQLCEDETCRTEAVAGISTTRSMVATSLPRHTANYSLCHGLAGNAEVLLHAAEILGSAWENDRALAIRVADDGIERFASQDQSWPCGARLGVTPNLMVGLAGIGHFYLRLHDPAIPSVLLLRPESFQRASGLAPEIASSSP